MTKLKSESVESPSAELRTKILALVVVLLLATVLAYAGSFRGVFVLDDLRWIVKEPRVRNLLSDWRNLSRDTRPLFHLSVTANHALGGLDVRGYHAFNLAVHLLAGLLLFGVVRRTIRRVTRQRSGVLPAEGLAFAVSLIWLIHPLQTESVTYLVQRCESMMGMFFLLCLYAVVRGAESRRPGPWYLTAVFACGLGMSCKEVMLTAPPLVLLFDRVFLASSWREVLRRRGLLHAALLAVASALIVFSLPALLGGEEGTGFGLQKVTPLAYLRTQPGVLLHYLRLAFWPHPLCLDYRWPVANAPGEICPPAAVVAGLLAASFLALRHRPWLGFLGLFFFVVLAPSSSLLPIADLAVEHRMYLPLAALITLVVVACYGLGRLCLRTRAARRLAGLGVLTAVALTLTVMTWERNRDYSDDYRLWSKVIEVAPHNYRAHHSLAQTYVVKGDLDSAKRCYEKAIQLRPDYGRSHAALGYVLLRLGDFEQAGRHLRRATELGPDCRRTVVELGDLLIREQHYEEAALCYRAAIEADPQDANAVRNLGLALQRLARTEEAAAAYREALRLAPDMVSAKIQLAWLLSTAGEVEVRNGSKAVRLAEEARTQLGKDSYRLLDVLAAAYAEMGRYDEACRAAAKAAGLAEEKGAKNKAEDLRNRLSLYRKGQPYRESSETSERRTSVATSGGDP